MDDEGGLARLRYPSRVTDTSGAIASSPILKAHRFLELDSLRGLAALTVVLAHFSGFWAGTQSLQRWENSPGHVLTAGHEAVVFFFVLSGFVLSVPFAGSRKPGYAAYLLKRMCRIYLPYAAAVLLAYACAAQLYGSHTDVSNAWINATWSERPSPHLLLSALLMRSAAAQQMNTAFWSVIYEVRISLIFPLLYVLFRKMQARWAVPILLLACAGASMLPIAGLANWFVASLFVVGILLHRELPAIHRVLDRMSPLLRAALLLGSWVVFEFARPCFPLLRVRATLTTLGFADFVVAVGAVGVIAFATRPGKLQRVLTAAPLLRLGLLSYSTYLVHATVLFCILRSYNQRIAYGWYFVPFLLLVYAASEAFYYLVDQPSVLLGRRAGALLGRLGSAG